MLKQSIRTNAIVLAIFALVTSLLLSATFLGTKNSIAEAERRAAQKTLLELYPEETHDNDVLADTLPIPEPYLNTLGLKRATNLHVVRQSGVVTGFIVPATAPDGYSGEIRLLVGINSDGTLAGVRTVAHNETPGLGDQIDLRKSQWILGFNGKSLGDPDQEQWKVKKDKGVFDQFTGATITPRAVVGQVLKTLIFFQEHRAELLKSATDNRSGGQHEQ